MEQDKEEQDEKKEQMSRRSRMSRRRRIRSRKRRSRRSKRRRGSTRAEAVIYQMIPKSRPVSPLSYVHYSTLGGQFPPLPIPCHRVLFF